MPVTFVSAFLNLFEDRSILRSPDTHISNFRTIALTGIPIVLFISNSYRDDYERLCGNLPNVHVEYTELYEFEAYTDIEGIDVKLPPERNHVKDTRNFLVLMNTKLECLHRAMEITTTSHYAWIDFGIKHVLTGNSFAQLVKISNATFPMILAMPGCWQKGSVFFDKIHWRFCGGFFLGDKSSLESFYEVGKANWLHIISAHNLTWEVNYWAFLEQMNLIQPLWYPGDHDDSILNVPEL